MKENWLTLRLLSGTTPGRGEGTAGEVDIEIEHDEYGLPFIRGKTIHGLLLDSWLQMAPFFPGLHDSGLRVFGRPSSISDTAILHIGNAVLPEEVKKVVCYAIHRKNRSITPHQILRTLTYIRRQTAQARETGAAEDTTLRSTRVIMPGLVFTAPLTWLTAPSSLEKECLNLSVRATRQIGTNRHRGFGYVEMKTDFEEKAYTLMAAGVEG